MGIYNPNNSSDPLQSTGDGGNAVVTFGSATVSAASANGDKYRPCRIPGGTKVHRVVVKNTDLDSGTPAILCKIGYAPLDGSAGDDDALGGAGLTILQAAATTTYEIFPPVLVEKDSYLQIEVTTGPGTGATGTVSAKVEGEAVGVR